MPSEKHLKKPDMSTTAPFGMFGPAVEYIVDAAQCSILFFDVMRQRGNQYREHLAETVPHVLEWWGGHANLNAEEIQFIADQLLSG